MTITRRTPQAKRSARPAKTAAPARADITSRRITNVRANASGLGSPGSVVPGQIVAARTPKK